MWSAMFISVCHYNCRTQGQQILPYYTEQISKHTVVLCKQYSLERHHNDGFMTVVATIVR